MQNVDTKIRLFINFQRAITISSKTIHFMIENSIILAHLHEKICLVFHKLGKKFIPQVVDTFYQILGRSSNANTFIAT